MIISGKSFLYGTLASAILLGIYFGVSGTTSTVAMVSCCAHYLTSLVPILGVTGLATFIAQYQIGIFWIGLAFNLFGIAFIANKIFKFKKNIRE